MKVMGDRAVHVREASSLRRRRTPTVARVATVANAKVFEGTRCGTLAASEPCDSVIENQYVSDSTIPERPAISRTVAKVARVAVAKWLGDRFWSGVRP